MDYVTDTHSLVWYFTDDARLGKKAWEAFEGTIREGLIIIPSIVLAEIMFIAKKGKISLSFAETLDRIHKYQNFDIAPLDTNILKQADKIALDLEMHDKLIVSTALYFGAKLITKDSAIADSRICSTIW